MKKIVTYSFILFWASFALKASETEWVDQFLLIYRDAQVNNYGHSYNRTDPLKLDIYLFGKSKTFAVNNNEGFLTAVTLAREIKESLDLLLEKNQLITIGDRSLRLVESMADNPNLEQPIYVYQEKERGIFVGFTLEKAPQEMLDFINTFYANEPQVAEIVTNYYRENYVIRIIQADTILSRQTEPTLSDILLSATLLGDSYQQLLGIHDGLNYLGNLQQFYEQRFRYKILTDAILNEKLPPR